jgi:hypothetical protein
MAPLVPLLSDGSMAICLCIPLALLCSSSPSPNSIVLSRPIAFRLTLHFSQPCSSSSLSLTPLLFVQPLSTLLSLHCQQNMRRQSVDSPLDEYCTAMGCKLLHVQLGFGRFLGTNSSI